jgi:hypothetical protein
VTGTTSSKAGKKCYKKSSQWEKPSTAVNDETVSKVTELVHEDRRITIEVVNEVGILYGSAQKILTEVLWMREDCAKFVHDGWQMIKGSAAILGGKTNHNHSTATVFARHHTLWPLALSQTKDRALRPTFCKTWRHQSNVKWQLYSL